MGSVKLEPEFLGAGDNSRNDDMNVDYHEPEDLDIHYNKAIDRDIKLMEAYRQMPILYDRDHPDFRYVNKKEKAWKELSKKTSMSLENCRKRVTYIRARFTVERRMLRNGQLSSDWPLMDKLKFLHKHVQIRRLRGNDDTEPDGEYEEEHQNNPCTSTSYYNHNNGASSLHNVAGIGVATASVKRHSDEDEDVRALKRRQSVEELEPIRAMSPYRHQSMYMPLPEVKTPDICVNGPPFPKRDENCIFGEYVAEVLKKLPRTVQPKTTLKIMEILVEAQEANMANESTHTATDQNINQ